MIEISVSNVKKAFEVGKNILDGLTFQIESGERVGLLGRNGAGKSTLFKLLTGELEADEGDIAIAKNRRLGLLQYFFSISKQIWNTVVRPVPLYAS